VEIFTGDSLKSETVKDAAEKSRWAIIPCDKYVRLWHKNYGHRVKNRYIVMA